MKHSRGCKFSEAQRVFALPFYSCIPLVLDPDGDASSVLAAMTSDVRCCRPERPAMPNRQSGWQGQEWCLDEYDNFETWSRIIGIAKPDRAVMFLDRSYSTRDWRRPCTITAFNNHVATRLLCCISTLLTYRTTSCWNRKQALPDLELFRSSSQVWSSPCPRPSSGLSGDHSTGYMLTVNRTFRNQSAESKIILTVIQRYRLLR